MDSNWGRVYFTNLLASIPLLVNIIYREEIVTVKSISGWGLMALLWSCCLGLAMSYFAYMARIYLTAAHFTVVGNVCKILTIFINFLMWDKHASPIQLMALGLCLICAYFYKQAPPRAPSSSRTGRGVNLNGKGVNERRGLMDSPDFKDSETTSHEDEFEDNAAHEV